MIVNQNIGGALGQILLKGSIGPMIEQMRVELKNQSIVRDHGPGQDQQNTNVIEAVVCRL